MMNGVQEALHFILLDGTLLVGLFMLITMLVFLVQQLAVGSSIQRSLADNGRGRWRGATLAAVGGAVTPFCSCSTVPVLSGMLRAGIPLSACFAFLIASPVINEGVVVLLAGSSGGLEVAIYILLAGAVSVVAGVAVEAAGLARYLRPDTGPDLEPPDGDLGTGKARVRPRLSFALSTAWAGTLMEVRHLGPYLAAGILAGALIYGYVPTEVLVATAAYLPTERMILAAALVAAPLYISPLVAVPIGFALIEKGIGVGPVVAFLIAGAGTSLPEMIMLARMFRWQLLLAHIATVLLAALALGFAAHWTLDLDMTLSEPASNRGSSLASTHSSAP
jgi:uncharacterized membrane protein YraQ (UPF0718 family)